MNVLTFVSHCFLALTIMITSLFMVPLVPLTSRWYQLVIVQSASMEPALKVGSLAIYQPRTEYNPGDIVAYRYGNGSDSKIILHRITEKHANQDELTFTTKGDALTDGTAMAVYARQVQGRVIGSIPNVGFLLSWLQTPKGIAIALFVPLALLLINQLTRLP